jgi:pectinesterase
MMLIHPRKFAFLSFATIVASASSLGAASGDATAPPAADSTVALDGSAQFKTVQAAVDAAPTGREAPFTIHIAPGH